MNKTNQMKTYVITVSEYFPKTHIRSGDETGFPEKILSALEMDNLLVHKCFQKPPEKIHTVRANYPLWKKRFEKIDRGDACLSIRRWTGTPYRSKQEEIVRLTKKDGIGLQELVHPDCFISASIEGKQVDWSDIAKNDGLLFEDFCEWFNVRQKEPMAIIHFTKFRY